MCGIHEVRQHRIAVVSFAVLFFTAAALSAAITGSVLDESGAPIAHANVAAFAQETPRDRAARILAGRLEREPLAKASTADDGSFRLETTEPVVELTIAAAGRQAFSTDATSSDDIGTVVLAQRKADAVRVIDESGKPVRGALVIAGQFAGRTGEDGTIALPDVVSGPIAVVHPDYAAVSGGFPAVDSVREVKLARGVTLKGRVMSEDGRRPVEHATVSVGLYTSTQTSADGTFTLAHVSSRWTQLRAAGPSGAAFIANNGLSTFDVRLRPAASIRGSVRDTGGRSGVAGARVTFVPRVASDFTDTAITDAKGNFGFDAVPTGFVAMSLTHPRMQLLADAAPAIGAPGFVQSGSFGPGLADMEIGAGQRQTVTLTVRPLAVIRGHVIDDGRKPVAAAMIDAASMGGSIRGRMRTVLAYTNVRGEFTLRIAGSGETMMAASKDGYVAATLNTITNPVKGDIVLTLHRGVPLVVRTVDAEKKPVSRAMVTLMLAAPGDQPQPVRCGNAPCLTREDGTVEMRIEPGTYTARVAGQLVVAKTFPAQKLTATSSPLVLTVERGVEVAGRVVYGDGSPASDINVVMRVEGGAEQGTSTDSSGAFSFSNAPRGPLTLRVPRRPQPGMVDGPSKQVNAPVSDVVLTMPPSGRITGTVVDSATRQPVTDFQVGQKIAYNATRPVPFTSNDGSFVLDHIPAGHVDLEASATGYSRGSVNGIEVTEGKTTAGIEIKLDPAAHVTGRVTARDGSALSGVFAMALDSVGRRGAPLDSAMSDSNGEYTLSSVPAGEHHIAFSKSGYLRQEKSVTAEVAKESRLDVVLDQGLDLRGRVVDDNGQPVGGADVRIQATGETSAARSDADGMFVLSGLRDAPYTIVARRNGYAEARLDNTTPSTPNVTLTLRRGATITGHVSGINAADASSVMVMVRGAGTGSSTRADASGNFSLSGIPDGHFIANASLFQPGTPVRRSADVGVDVVNGSSSPVEIVFTEGITIQGRVTMNGSPASSGTVMFRPMSPSDQTGTGSIGSDGTYVVSGVTAGNYSVAVNSAAAGFTYWTKYTVSGPGVFDIDMRTGALTGHVTDAQTSAPLANAQVNASAMTPTPGGQRQAVTDSSGLYAFDPMIEGSWRLNVQKDGYQADTREIAVSGPTTLDVQLSAGTKLTLHVVDGADGHSLAADVSLFDRSRQAHYSSNAGTDGVAEVWVPPGTYFVGAYAAQYVSEPQTVTVPSADVQITMRRTGRVQVRWTTPGVKEARLTGPKPAAPPPAGVGGYIMTTLRSPVGTFENVRPGSWTATLVDDAGKTLAQQPVVVASGQTATVVFP